jgi:hypothetical protein
MGRIRSIHPGFFTDENYMVLSMAARAAMPGIWTECDDNGVFEWKPIVLKAKLFPADNVDMCIILAELSENGWVKRIESDGKSYGLARNFRKWQRPEKPKARHPLPECERSYVGLKPTDTQPVTDESPTDQGKSPQREEEGGRREEEGCMVLANDSARATGDHPHSQTCTALLDTRSADLTAWESEFLISIKWVEKLTKAQSEKLNGIQDRLAARIGTPVALPSVKRGTPAYDAWIAHYRKKGRATFFERQDAFTVPTEYPPQEQVA